MDAAESAAVLVAEAPPASGTGIATPVATVEPAVVKKPTTVPSTQAPPITHASAVQHGTAVAERPTVTAERPERTLAREILSRMTLDQKIGQVFMLGFEGAELNERNIALVRDLHLGGVTLFARNVKEPEQVARLIADLQTVADPVPLFVSIDQEGGLVVRVSQGATIFPGSMALGATGDTALAERVAAASGRELAAMGINMNLAPVVDVNTNPLNPVIGVRAFGADPHEVGAFGAATVRGLHEAGVSAVAKHFPGHGDTIVDSHLDLPVVGHDLARLQAKELPPFQAAIEAGVDGVMTAHVYLPSIEPRQDVPATLSKAVLTNLLRDAMGFDGLILTDALDMRAITQDRTAAQAAIEAFEAGADLLLIAGITQDDRRRLAEGPPALLTAVRSGRISEERLDESVLRILEAKAKRGILRAPDAPAPSTPALDVVGSAAHRDLATEVARKAVTLIRDHERLLPLDTAQRILVVQPDHPTRSLVVEEVGSKPSSLAEAVRRFAPNADEVRVEPAPSPATIARVVEHAWKADAVVLATYDHAQLPSQIALANAIHETGKPVLAVALRGPYDADALPRIGTFLAAYGDRPVHVRAAAEALFGQLTPAGRLP